MAGPYRTPRSAPYDHPRAGDKYSADAVIERIAWLMDGSIPLPGGYRVGLDPIIGLVPGVGDLLTTLISCSIVLQAQRAGIPKPTLLRMVANVGIDAVVGAVPFIGDLFDFTFKANLKNLKLYREARQGVRDTRRDVGFLALLLVVLGMIVALPVLLLIALLRAVL